MAESAELLRWKMEDFSDGASVLFGVTEDTDGSYARASDDECGGRYKMERAIETIDGICEEAADVLSEDVRVLFGVLTACMDQALERYPATSALPWDYSALVMILGCAPSLDTVPSLMADGRPASKILQANVRDYLKLVTAEIPAQVNDSRTTGLGDRMRRTLLGRGLSAVDEACVRNLADWMDTLEGRGSRD